MQARLVFRTFSVVTSIILVLLPTSGRADRVQIPLALDHQFIESLLREQVFTGAGEAVRLNDDGSGCQYLELREPRVSASGGRMIVRTDARARTGRTVGNRCLLILDWQGQLEFVQEVSVGSDRQSILLRTASWRALRPDGSVDNLSTTIGGWVDRFLPVALAQTRIDFAQPLDQLRAFLEVVISEPDTAAVDALLDSIAIDDVLAANDRATVTLGMEAPAAQAAPAAPVPALTDAELARIEPQLDAVDAFFAYTIKAFAGSDAVEPTAFLDVLIELRRDLVQIVSTRQPTSADPARRLFVDAWQGLVPSLRLVAEGQGDQADALRYLTFISAGDALRVLDQLGPAVGVEVSRDGLRRLARMLVPGDGADPLQRDEGVDAELRRSLGFGEPLPPPRDYLDTTWIDSWLDWLVPSAVAAASLEASVVKKLNNWVPRNQDMEQYLPMVRDVLEHVVAEQLRDSEIDPAFRGLFRTLVFAAAWQESCWRQFTAENDLRVPVKSSSGDLGMMQINPRVWRGLYDIQGLRWDIVYNARAGSDILEHYLVDYAIRHREHQTTGAVDNLARSAYAAYNGGPRQYDRYRSSAATATGKKVDALFHQKYQAVKSGKELAVTACYGG